MQYLSPQSYWCQTTAPTSYPPLSGDLDVEVAIVGGGVTGLTAAMALRASGRSVAVLEAGPLGAGTSSGTTAHLDVYPDIGFVALIQKHGEESARLLTAARRQAIDQIAIWCQQYAIDCDYREIPGYYFGESESDQSELQEELAAAQRLGVAASLVAPPLPFAQAGAVRVERMGRCHALRYLQGLAQTLQQVDNIALYEQTRVSQPPRSGEFCLLQTDRGQVRAKSVILATHANFLGISVNDARVAPYQSYVVAVESPLAIEDALYWDTQDPYHYIRWADSSQPQLLLIGGADHKTGQGDELAAFAKLEQYARDRFGATQIQQRWSAEFFESDDGIPIIGEMPMTQNLFVATGFLGSGITWGTAAGLLLAELVQGRAPAWAELVSPARFNLSAGGTKFVSENWNVAKHFIGDRLTLPSWSDQEQTNWEPGTGRTVRHQGEILAVYRDQAGQFHCRSAVCTHAGCIVQWNQAEATWDCPCHGGRYAPDGTRLYGPPHQDLENKKDAMVQKQ